MLPEASLRVLSRRHHFSVVALVVAAAFVLSACEVPRDPESTLDRVSGGTMRVGVSHNPPWVNLDGTEPTGVEVELVEAFAAELNADVEFYEGATDDLAAAIHVRELDLVIAGLTATTTLSSEITVTHPYLTTAVVVGVPPESDVREDITGLEVAVERGTEAAGLLEKTDAVVVRVDDVTTAPGAAAVENYLLDDLDLRDTGVRLIESDHVMGMPGGENAWLVELERFLLQNEDLIDRLLEEHDET